MKLTKRIHPPCNCKDCLEVEEKARKLDTLTERYKKLEKIDLVEIEHEVELERQNQKLRELVEKYYKHSDLTISSICKQMLEECKE